MSDGGESLAVKTVMKLVLSAEHYASASPALARFYMWEAEHLKKKLHLPASTASQICPYCYTMWRPDNCTRRLMPKMKTGRQLRRLKKRSTGDGTASRFAKSLLELHSEGINRLEIHCRSCRKRVLVDGARRSPKALKLPDLLPANNAEVQTPKKKKKKKSRKSNGIVDSNSKQVDAASVRKEMEQRSFEKYENKMTLRARSEGMRKVTNKKETLKQKHSMLQNILKRKTDAASPNTSASLKSFLMSL